MSFSSIYFLFLFFPLFFIIYHLHSQVWYRNAVLLLGSLIFFGWADPTHLHILAGSVLFNYLFGLLIEFCQARQKTLPARIFMWLAVLLNIALLFFYKYLGFFAQSYEGLIGVALTIKKLALPLGISYFTFSGISYILDVYYRVEKAERNLLRFSTYLVMFPKILQGPITRFAQVKNELNTVVFNYDDILEGVRRFIIGLAKKVIIADSLAVATKKVFGADLHSIGMDVAWFGLIAFTLQIYFDFSGYTDMAVGLGKILGFKLPENFNYPYISRSISDFWRRWHMTLTSWFRNYLFTPLEFARKKVKHFRQQSDIFIVFLLTGLWHGASWNFLIWGGYFGLILALEASGFGKKLKTFPRIIQHFYASLLIMIGWIFFRLTDVNDWGPFFGALVGANSWTGTTTLRTLNVIFFIPLLVLAVFLSAPWLRLTVERICSKAPATRIVIDILYLCLFILTVGYILSNGYAAFMYGDF